MRYTAIGHHNRHFELLDERQSPVGKLDYAKWFSTQAKIELPDGTVLDIVNKTLFHTSMHLMKGDEEMAQLRFNWKGQIVLTMTDGTEYLLKGAGFFNHKYHLHNSNDIELITLDPDFSFSKMSYNYDITTNDNYKEANDATMLLLCIYLINYQQNAFAGAGAV